MKKILIAFIALGLVSLFADMTYEGARSVIGAYFEMLGASALIAGAVGVGEFLGYAMRGVSGVIAGIFKSSKVYWGLVYLGYIINLFAVPLLAFTGNWESALLLVILERVGKGLRTPVRDVILAEVTESIGRGKGFGIHEVMDQIGAIAGPALVMYAIGKESIRYAFLILTIPAMASISMLILASTTYPKLKSLERRREGKKIKRRGILSKAFLFYIIAMAMLSLGFIHWSLFIYHVSYAGLMPVALIPTLYIISMATDAIVAFPVGYIYDKIGPKSILITPLLALITVPLLLHNKVDALITASIIWGIVMGIYETSMRVVVADLSTPETRSYAYGIYGLVYGFSWGIGNTIMGALYVYSKSYLIAYVVIMEMLALVMIIKTLRIISKN